MFPPRRSLAGALVGVLYGAMPAAAAGGELPVLEAVTVVGKVEQPLAEVAASVSVLTAADIESSLATDLRGLLRSEPGLAIGADPHRFGAGSISIRGLGGNRVLLETDGVPAPAAFRIGSYSSAGRPFADLEVIERIEVLRGPASSLYGSDAIAGVVATTTRNPDALLEPGDDLALRARSGYAAADGSWFGAVTAAARTATADMMIAWGRRERGPLDIASDDVVSNPRDSHSDTLLARARWLGFAAPLRLTVSWDRIGTATEVNSLELSPGRFANTTSLAGDDRSENLRIVLDQRLQGWHGFEQAEWRLYAQQSEVRQRSDELRRAAPPRSPPLAIRRSFAFTEDTSGGELTVARQFETGGGLHRMVAGVEASLSRITEVRDGLQTNLSTGAVTQVILGESLPLRDFPVTDVATAGAYLQDEWAPAGSSWSLVPALRMDWSRLDPRPDRLYREDNPTQQPVSVEHLSVSPKIGLSWRPVAGATLYLQYAHGFRSPPFEDVNIGLELPQFNIRAIPNPDLEPERSDSVETGVRLQAGPVSAEASVYYSRYRDFIESKVNLGPDPTNGTTIFQSRNVASAVIRGAEAAIDWTLPRSGWSARVAAAYARGDDTERNRPLDSIEPLRAVVSLAYDEPAGRFGTELLLTAVAAKRRIAPATVPAFAPSGWSTVDITAYWQPRPWLRVDAGIFNLADRSYFSWSDVGKVSSGDPLLEYYRRPGRNGSVSLTASF